MSFTVDLYTGTCEHRLSFIVDLEIGEHQMSFTVDLYAC